MKLDPANPAGTDERNKDEVAVETSPAVGAGRRAAVLLHSRRAERHPAARDHPAPVSYTHLRAHETVLDLVCRLLLEKKKQHM